MKEKLQSGFNNNGWISSVSICATKTLISVCMLFFVSWPSEKPKDFHTSDLKLVGATWALSSPVAASASFALRLRLQNRVGEQRIMGTQKKKSLLPGRPIVWNRHVHDDVATLLSPPYCKTADIVASPIKHILAFIVAYFHFLIFQRCYNLFLELWINCSNKWIKQILVIFET